MSEMYYRHWRKMSNWHKVKMWTEKKLMKPHKFFGIFKLYDTQGSGAYGGGGQKVDQHIEPRIKKFLQKYPHAADYSSLTAADPENYVQGEKNPIARFLFRQDKFMSQGFDEDKAFELAEKEMSEELQKEKYERSLFEGLATSNRSRSLMSIYEQKAEYESRQKVKQLERDLGQFKRYQTDIADRYEQILQEKGEIVDQSSENKTKEKIKKYEPVTYRTHEMKDEGTNQKSIQSNFSSRSERLLDYFHSFAEIKDGISNLSDREIILKANETPGKLKDSFNTLKKKLEKYEIKLNSKGKIDYTCVNDKNSISWIQNNEQLITVCLLCKDLDFEAPHIINKMEIKNKIMSEIEEEEKRLAQATQRQTELVQENEIERLRKRKMNYENYFGIMPNYNADVLIKQTDRLSQGAGRNMKKFLKYEEFVKEFSNRYLFDNDLLYETYYYWEDLDEKELRLRDLWIKSKRTILEKSIKRPEINVKEITKINEEISTLVRNLRRRIDQTLLKNRKHPIFGSNYRFLKTSEFMLDSEIEFHKIKKFLENSPDKIKKDPEIGYKYRELLDLLKRKKIGEATHVMFEDVTDEPAEAVKEEVVEEVEEGIEQREKFKVSGKSRSSKVDLERAVGYNKNLEKVDEELGKVKDKIVSHFESILKAQTVGAKTKKTDEKKSIKGVKSLNLKGEKKK